MKLFRRLIYIILGLAAYGAYTLLTNLTGHQVVMPWQTAAPRTSSLAEHAIQLAASSAGLVFVALPATGCSPSVMSPSQVSEFVSAIPDPQRSALARVLSASSSVWTVQLYRGSFGVGVCLPSVQRLLVMPKGLSAITDQLGALPAATGGPTYFSTESK